MAMQRHSAWAEQKEAGPGAHSLQKGGERREIDTQRGKGVCGVGVYAERERWREGRNNKKNEAEREREKLTCR